MKISRTISTVEVHTGGEAFRIVTSGLPRLPGDTLVKRRAWLKENADEIRRALMFEPRGHADMYGGYLTEPVSATADFGIIFLHNEGYSDHCGHGVIALSTAAVELGWVQRQIPETRVGIDAPCGFIEAFVQWDGEHAGNVRFVNVPSFIWKRDVTVETASFGKVTGDIAFGGAFYFYTDGEPHGLAVRESSVEELIRFGAEVKVAANNAFPVEHPHIGRSITSTEPSSPTHRDMPGRRRRIAASLRTAKWIVRRPVPARAAGLRSSICVGSWRKARRS
jgi:trans-L-3-hydroxyproline dehydratase